MVGHAPADADHLILTYSHDIDLALCDALLRRTFGSIGLIGSDTKWARFRSRLQRMGHSKAQIARIKRLNALNTVTKEVVEAARECLVIGST